MSEVKDAWSAIAVKMSKEQVPVYRKDTCPVSGQPAPPPETRLYDFAKCPTCGYMVYVRKDGNFMKHTDRSGSRPQDVIVLQTGRKQRIEIAATDVTELVDQLLALIGERTTAQLREDLYQAEYGNH